MENFVAILRGDSKAVKGGNGKVLRSTKNSMVFINTFSNYGNEVIGFASGNLNVSLFNETLRYMHTYQLYKEMVFYIEGSNGQSMFRNGVLTDEMNIYAATSANFIESSWATHCPNDNLTVHGVKFDVCLASQFSAAWMEDIEKRDISKFTLAQQFDVILEGITSSHPQ